MPLANRMDANKVNPLQSMEADGMHCGAMNPEWFESQRVLQCLGDESRFRVMTELVRGDRCVTELAMLVGLSQSCTTRHLQVLERTGMVSSRRSGKRVVFCVREEPRVVALLAWALPLDVHRDHSRGPGDPVIPGQNSADDAGNGSQRVAPECGSPSSRVSGNADDTETPPASGSRGRARELEDFLL